MDNVSRRRYKRIGANWVVRIRRRPTSDADLHSLEERIRNISSSGVFIETRMPFPAESVIEFDFTIPGRNQKVHAVGRVRWINDGRHAGMPMGMGIEFAEISSECKTVVEKMVRDAETDRLASLRTTPDHQKLLRFYAHHVGDTFKLDDLAREIGLSKDQITLLLVDFALFELVGLAGEIVTFKPSQDPEIKQAMAAERNAGAAPP